MHRFERSRRDKYPIGRHCTVRWRRCCKNYVWGVFYLSEFSPLDRVTDFCSYLLNGPDVLGSEPDGALHLIVLPEIKNHREQPPRFLPKPATSLAERIISDRLRLPGIAKVRLSDMKRRTVLLGCSPLSLIADGDETHSNLMTLQNATIEL